jgi:hypothetical protein
MDFLLGLFRDADTNTALVTIIACSGGHDHRPPSLQQGFPLSTREFTQQAQWVTTCASKAATA